eukprot:4525579-Prymnesium_polylepis.1
MARHCNLAVQPIGDKLVWRRLEEPAESAAVTIRVIFVNQDNLDATAPCNRHFAREIVAVFAHKSLVVKIEQHVGDFIQDRSPS